MNALQPSVTVIIPTRPGQEEIPAVVAVRALEYPSNKLEVLIARGRQPAVQRNAALRQARGDLIYFLDDDAQPLSENLRRALAHFARPEIKMVGGPNLCPTSAPFLEQIFAVVLSSVLAFGPSRARYDALGKARESGEKELILCNLLARKETMLALGGFDESLYPNEENALMDAVSRSGGKMIYDPALVVYRRPRASLRSFFKMLMTYGRGRAEQFRRHPTTGSILNFAPPLFCLYLLTMPWWGVIGWVPLGFYALAIVAQVILSSPSKGLGRSLLAAPLVVMTHLLYGLGFWRGLFTRLSQDRARAGTDEKIVIDRLTL